MKRRHLITKAALAVITIPAGLIAATLAGNVHAAVPEQLLAKAHTEVLGRLPTQAEWQTGSAAFTSSGCNVTAVRDYLRAFYLSSEYAALGYDNAARVLTLYRGSLNREPDAPGFTNYLGLLNGGTSWSAVVDAVLATPEFVNQVVPLVCGAAASYGWGTAPAIAIPTSGSGFAGGTGAQLQALLNAAPSGATVWLANKALVRVTSPLIIPAGVTLATVGMPGPTRYASLGRVVRAGFFLGESITVRAGGRLDSVWVDGQRGAVPRITLPFLNNGINVSLVGGDVVNSVLSNSGGWTSMQMGTADGTVCTATVTGNLVTSYSSNHNGDFSDGISSYCDDGLLANNQVVDTTDVGIIIFSPSSGASQHSQVRNNVVLAAGNNAYGAYAADGTIGKSQPPSFIGSHFHDNVFWSGGRTHIDIGLVVGTRAWFGTASSTGVGAAFTNNSTGTLSARVASGIAVAGMLDVTVQGNALNVDFAAEASPCPRAVVGASVAAGHASGTIQPYTDALYESCIQTGD